MFAIASFIDELAGAATTDLIAFRLARPKDARARAAIEAVAKKANWKDGEIGDRRRGRGIGFAKYKTLSVYVAVIAEVEVDPASGVIKVHAYAVADAGQIINPDGLTFITFRAAPACPMYCCARMSWLRISGLIRARDAKSYSVRCVTGGARAYFSRYLVLAESQKLSG